MKKFQKITKAQKKRSLIQFKQENAIGTNCPKNIYSNQFSHLYQEFDYYNEQKDEIQTYNEFLDMGKRCPNAKGTGRFKLENNRNTIGIYAIGKNMATLAVEIQKWVEVYFCLKVKIINPQLKLKKSKNEYSFIDENKQLEFPLVSLEKRVNVFSMIDVLIEYVPKDIFSIVTLVDCEIYDPEQPSESILGRACGNRVCVVGADSNKKQFYGTIAHELMHTMGLDHCFLWYCNMNSEIGSFIQLCPLDLRKLQNVIGFDVKKRYSKLETYFHQNQWNSDFLWVKKMIKYLDEEVPNEMKKIKK